MSKNFAQEFLNEILSFGDKTCLIWQDKEISFNEFHEMILNWRNIIDHYKKQTSSSLRVALFSTNSPDILAIIIASQLAGVTVIPLNPSYKKYEIDKYLLESRANFMFVSDDVDMEKFEGKKFRKISDLLATSDLKPATKTKSSGVIVFFSSGTTGPPKLFEYTQRVLCAQLDQIKNIREDPSFFSPSQEDICYGVLPFFHAGGLVTVLSMIYSGCTVVINERWNEQEFLSNCQKYKVSVLFLVPPVLDFFANSPLVSTLDLSSLKTIYVGAAASPPNHFKKVAKRLPGLENLIHVYGTTECGVLLCSTGKGISKGDTIGLPLPFVKFKIGRDNEISIKSATAVEEGFMETGDLGALTQKQTGLMIIGRAKEMLKIRGWQVNPIEIEDVIRIVPNIADCAVYQQGPNKLIAKVIAGPDPDPELELDIMFAIRTKLCSYKQIDEVKFVTELPRNASGKLLRYLLLQQ